MGAEGTAPIQEITEVPLTCQKCQGILADGTRLKKNTISQIASLPLKDRLGSWEAGLWHPLLETANPEGRVGYGAGRKPTNWTPLSVVPQKHLKQAGCHRGIWDTTTHTRVKIRAKRKMPQELWVPRTWTEMNEAESMTELPLRSPHADGSLNWYTSPPHSGNGGKIHKVSMKRFWNKQGEHSISNL